MRLKHLGLFEGIGGFSLAAMKVGWETVAWVENNEHRQKLLRQNLPNATGYGDIKKFNGSAYRGAIDVLSGGFPCQTFSLAGKGAVDLSLWKEMFRVVGEVRPKEWHSPLCTLTWKMKAMSQCRRLLFQLVPRVHGTNEIGFGLLPTLAASEGFNSGKGKPFVTKNGTVRMKNLDGSSSRLGLVGVLRFLPTLTARDSQREGFDAGMKRNSPNLTTILELQTGIRGQLNPLWAEGFMGYPIGWTELKEGLGNAIYPQIAYEIFKAIDSL